MKNKNFLIIAIFNFLITAFYLGIIITINQLDFFSGIFMISFMGFVNGTYMLFEYVYSDNDIHNTEIKEG